jgi:hypothetical protein
VAKVSGDDYLLAIKDADIERDSLMKAAILGRKAADAKLLHQKGQYEKIAKIAVDAAAARFSSERNIFFQNKEFIGKEFNTKLIDIKEKYLGETKVAEDAYQLAKINATIERDALGWKLQYLPSF